MKKFLAALSVAGTAILLSAGAASASTYPPSSVATAKANVACNKAILSDKVVTAKTLKACEATVTTGSKPAQVCSHGTNVYELWLYPGDVPLIRVGYKPAVFTEANFYVSDETQLCGDPTPAGDTPPKPAMTQAQVKAAFKTCERAQQCAVKLPKSLGGGS
jgi:hypothetical protein